MVTTCCGLPDAAASEASTTTNLVVRTCPTLDPGFLISSFEARTPGVSALQPGEVRVERVEWLAEVCVTGDILTSTLTNTVTGASDSRRVPIPADLGPDGATRLAATVLAAQFRAATETHDAGETSITTQAGPDGESAASRGAGEQESPVPLALVAGISFDSVGGMSGETGRPSIALGPGLRLGLLVDGAGIVELRAGSRACLGPSEVPASVSVVPLEVGGGYRFDLGPVFLGALAVFLAERWSPSGQVSAAGWRAGMAVAGRLSWPLNSLLEIHLDAGVEYFPEAYVFGYEATEGRVIVASLANWRWRGTLGLAFLIQLF